ncbi:hypothetical protein K0M31_000551 [Melipona bicolor]|uniref:Uncharacterized protein n=1 Tax=Melipona bicolor TaxID=60889 RepID=A0AA40KWU5_9HYME|nr:hypothetical protein K0M31_000551 [Melipona bicolor]
MNNRREASSHTREMRSNSPRLCASNAYQQDYASEHNIQYPEERSSVESVVETEEPGINKNNIHNYPDESVYVKILPKHNHAALRERYQRFNNYSEFSIPEATAMQKLQRLKELQMKRDISERYYSQEIKRLIGEYYFGPKIASPSLKQTGKLHSSSFHPSSADRLRNNLEPCGTMTTITRLDCGCIQETTRPIFTTARGRVLRRNCNLSQDENLLKLTSLNPQEHLFSSLEQPKDRYHAKVKKRLSMDPRTYSKIRPAGDQEFETENEKKNEEPETEITEHDSRTLSPQRKFSDTSANSY